MNAPFLATTNRTGWTYLPEFALANLPRYTSYPPANRFTAEIDVQQADNAVRALAQDATLSLYVHIPYCRALCWYCGCHTSVPTASDPLEPYVAALIDEITVAGRRFGIDRKVTHIHLGGGSPDILSRNQVARLFDALRTSFEIDTFAEIAAELDPRGASQSVVDGLIEAGLTRASLGVRVLDAAVQQRINRFQPAELVAHVISRLRSAGLQGLNIDMMYGLPGQTLEHVVETALFASAQDADRVAVFGYAHVPWFKKHQKAIPNDTLPDGERRFRQAEAASSALLQAGYMPVGFDHFAAPGDGLVTAERNGRLRRNFQGYTDDTAGALIGFGASAISSTPTLMWQNTTDTGIYRSSLAAGRLPISRGAAISEDDRVTGRLIERILCQFEADIPTAVRESAGERLAPLLAAGLAEFSANHLVVTERGRPYVRNIAAAFDTDLAPGVSRHSLAV